MRQLPTKRSKEQNFIIQATFDCYGEGLEKKEIPNVRNRENMKDTVYVAEFLKDPISTP